MKLPSYITNIITAQRGGIPQPDAENAAGNGSSVMHPGETLTRNPHAQESLNEFRHYMGIQNDPDLMQANRPVPNLGIYQRIVKAEKLYKDQYKVYSALINSALGLQIIFGAALTALGAGNGPRTAVTAFGAFNTILASILTFLKGSGLPNRMKYYHNELQKVREYIEQRERDFARGAVELDLRAEVAMIEEMYEAVKRDIEINTPDAYVSTTSRTGGGSQGIQPYGPAVHRQMDARDVSQYRNIAEDQYQNVRHGLESRLSQTRLGLGARLADFKQGFSEKAMEARADLDSRINTSRNDLESRYADARQDLNEKAIDARAGLNDRIGSSRQGLESRISQQRLGLESRLSQTRTGLESRVADARQTYNDRVTEAKVGLDDRINTTRQDVDTRLAEVRHDYDERAAAARAGLDDRLNNTRQDVDSRLADVRHDFDDRAAATRADLDDRISSVRPGLESRLSQERQYLADARRSLNAQAQQSQASVENQINIARLATAAQVEDTRHGLETRLEDTRAGMVAQVEDSRHGIESRMKEVQAQVKEQEDKIMGIAEKVAEKVLQVTQHRHDHDRN